MLQCAEVAGILEAGWPEHYGADGPGDSRADVAARQTTSGLPYGIAALTDAGNAIGTATLAGQSFGSITGEPLWCIGLIVDPQWRGQGIATALVATLELRARQMGFTQINATTQDASGVFKRNGWTYVRDAHNAAGVWKVFVKALAPI